MGTKHMSTKFSFSKIVTFWSIGVRGASSGLKYISVAKRAGGRKLPRCICIMFVI